MRLWVTLAGRSSSLAGFGLALRPGGGAADPFTEPSAPAQVTTDTQEYCKHLAWLYGLVQHASNFNDTLARDGAAMCEQGRVRMGVRALRRALAGTHAQP